MTVDCRLFLMWFFALKLSHFFSFERLSIISQFYFLDENEVNILQFIAMEADSFHLLFVYLFLFAFFSFLNIRLLLSYMTRSNVSKFRCPASLMIIFGSGQYS